MNRRSFFGLMAGGVAAAALPKLNTNPQLGLLEFDPDLALSIGALEEQYLRPAFVAAVKQMEIHILRYYDATRNQARIDVLYGFGNLGQVKESLQLELPPGLVVVTA